MVGREETGAHLLQNEANGDSHGGLGDGGLNEAFLTQQGRHLL
jgi:hypothetical protein